MAQAPLHTASRRGKAALESIDGQIAAGERRERVVLRLAWFFAGMTLMAFLQAVEIQLRGISP